MNRKLLVCAVAVCLCTSGFSQESYPSVLAAGGGESKTGSVMLEWTLGELVAESIVSSRALYTQGYHQPVLSVQKIQQNPEVAESQIDVFPNPATSVINVRIGFPHARPLTIILLDSKGSFLLKKEVPSNLKSAAINVDRFSQGAYILQIRNNNGLILQNYQVIKAQ